MTDDELAMREVNSGICSLHSDLELLKSAVGSILALIGGKGVQASTIERQLEELGYEKPSDLLMTR